MSASEKLRALDEAATIGPWEDDAGNLRSAATEEAPYLQGYMTSEWPNEEDPATIAALRNALPAIIAVVELAEAARPGHPALATLSQALEPGEGT